MTMGVCNLFRRHSGQKKKETLTSAAAEKRASAENEFSYQSLNKHIVWPAIDALSDSKSLSLSQFRESAFPPFELDKTEIIIS